MTKTQAVLDWLKTHASISSMEAIQNFGSTRLSAIVFNLRKRGVRHRDSQVRGHGPIREQDDVRPLLSQGLHARQQRQPAIITD